MRHRPLRDSGIEVSGISLPHAGAPRAERRIGDRRRLAARAGDDNDAASGVELDREILADIEVARQA
jgi:hypothetical protein